MRRAQVAGKTTTREDLCEAVQRAIGLSLLDCEAATGEKCERF
jgi:hypothetical protein